MASSKSKAFDAINKSFSFDRRLLEHDVRGSIAHARMLGKQGIIPASDARKLVAELKRILKDPPAALLKVDAEDVHMAVEAYLTRRLGAAGERLHTARSRNDQVALDLRLFVKAEAGAAIERLTRLIAELAAKAEKEIETMLPAYTHLQRAQPILLSFHLMAYAEMFLRDADRFTDCLRRADACPLGSGACSGTPFPVDRKMTAKELGFSSITANALDAVSDRDFVLDFLSAASICAVHLSRLGEEVILWSSVEFDFIRLPEALTSGSSMMPQKRNPDAAELVRGKAGRLFGNHVALLTALKGLPLAYNKDLQEDKEPLFDSVDTLAACLEVSTEMVKRMRVNRKAMEAAVRAGAGQVAATELADYLTRKGMPFRRAHGVAAKAAAFCQDRGIPMGDLPLARYRRFSDLFEADLFKVLRPETAIAGRNRPGGTARPEVRRQIRSVQRRIERLRKSLREC